MNSKTLFSSDFTLGILGGGQLGKMLLYCTRRMDIATSILEPDPTAPCRIGANKFTVGDIKDYDTVYNFGKTVDVLTIEIEHVNIEALEALHSEGHKIYPSPRALRIIQNKAEQKDFYIQNGIPTASFTRYDGIEKFRKAIQSDQISLPIVWKSTCGGYDGKGVSVIRSIQDTSKLPDVECIAEDLIPFENELAVIVARNPRGEVKTYPVVEMEFHPVANLVEYVICPARISQEVADKAREIALKIAEAFDTAGIMAVEMFLTKDGDIIVNETAPRVHNSGHYSIEGSYTCQFEQHLRAILDLPLGDTSSTVPAVMLNLTGEQEHTGDVYYQGMGEILAMPGVSPHIYGKAQTRPFRKMGHITITAPSLSLAREKAAKVKDIIKVISK